MPQSNSVYEMMEKQIIFSSKHEEWKVNVVNESLQF